MIRICLNNSADIDNLVNMLSFLLSSENDVEIAVLSKDDNYTSDVASEPNFERQISKILCDIGIPANLTGYHYLKDAIQLIIEDPEIIGRITKTLYPKIANKHNSTASRVERAIRHSISVAWSRGDTEVLRDIFGNTMNLKSGKPTNSEFIALIADKICIGILN